MTKLRNLFRWAGVDRATLYALSARGWQAGAGVVSVLLIVAYFSPVMQGFYYIFASLLALQVLVELGFYIVIVNTASHEWAKLHLDDEKRISGDTRARSRLISLGRFVTRWYSVGSILFMVFVGLGGYRFLSQTGAGEVSWQLPWVTTTVVTGLILWMMPLVSLLEGCHQVMEVQRFRFFQAIGCSAALWAVILLRGGLWAPVAAQIVNLLTLIFFVAFRYRRFFAPFVSELVTEKIHWKSEIWPMQWRLAVQGLVNYFMYWFFVPVTFHYHGAEAAGRVGMSWQLASMLQLLALAWIQTRVPRFGALVARGQYTELDKEWRHVTTSSSLFLASVAAAVWFVDFVLNVNRFSLAERLLDPLGTGLFICGILFAHLTQCQAAYLRAHKKEILTTPIVLSSLAMGVAVWWWGKYAGPNGVALAYVVVMATVAFPLMTYSWQQARRVWHS